MRLTMTIFFFSLKMELNWIYSSWVSLPLQGWMFSQLSSFDFQEVNSPF